MERFSLGPSVLLKFVVIALAWSGLLLSCPLETFAQERFQQPRRVLLLNSYHKGYLWTDEITRGVEDVFAGQNIELHVEYMDTKRQFGYLYRNYLNRLLSLKHIKHKHDAVITSDDNAFEFFREFRGRIARTSPHIFCGVNYLEPTDIPGFKGITGVNERVDIAANVALIRRLHPETRTVLVITDNTTPGKAVQEEVTRIRKKDWGGLKIDMVYDIAIDELGTMLRELPSHTRVLYTCFFRDKDHRFFEYNTSAKFVVEQTRGPVYCAWSFACGFGGVGGYMVDGYGQGQAAAKQVLQILEGTPVDEIPVQWTSPIILRFDYRQLAAHDIPLDKLPGEAEIINQPASFYYQYKVVIWNAVLVFFILALAFAGIMYGLIRVRKNEKKMAKSEFLHRSLFEKTNDAIFILDGTSGQCLDANPAARDISGRRLDELKHMTIREISPQSEKKWLASDQPENRAVDLGEVDYFSPDNTRKIARASSVCLEGNIVMAIAKDITHDLEMETQLRQAQKMEAIGTLAGGIAHDFNNILSSIFSYSQLAQMNIEADPEKANQHMYQVIKGAKRASELVYQILTFSRQADPQASHFEIGLIVKEAVKFLRSSIPASIEIYENINSQSKVLADPTQVHQVVMNLGTNAYHAIGDCEGRLTMELEDVMVSEGEIRSGDPGASPGPHVRLLVKDTGHGMDTAVLNKIFDPYFTTKKSGKGTGMGLSVVDGIIKRHGGFIRASSEVNKGTTFQIFWPVSSHEDVPTVEEKMPEPTDGNGHILVVDDEPAILKAMKALLCNQGYTVTVTQFPLEALALFENAPEKFDLLVTDMTMPKMTGAQLSETILGIREDMPIILCTGFHETLSESAALEMGIGKFLEKPFMPRDLYQAINTLLSPEGTGRK